MLTKVKRLFNTANEVRPKVCVKMEFDKLVWYNYVSLC